MLCSSRERKRVPKQTAQSTLSSITCSSRPQRRTRSSTRWASPSSRSTHQRLAIAALEREGSQRTIFAGGTTRIQWDDSRVRSNGLGQDAYTAQRRRECIRGWTGTSVHPCFLLRPLVSPSLRRTRHSAGFHGRCRDWRRRFFTTCFRMCGTCTKWRCLFYRRDLNL